MLLDNERWKQTEVLKAFQDISSNIALRGSSADDSLGGENENDKNKKNISVNAGIRSSPHDSPLTGEKAQSSLVVDGKKFAVVSSLLMLLRMLSDYCDFLDDIKVVTPGIVTRLADLLLLFNTRTRQLILGAGAMRLAGLKTITAKHLALSSQCLSVVLLIIPQILGVLRKHLPVKQQTLLSSFDAVVKDYEQHRKEIFAKLVSIMEDIFKRHLSAFKQWDEEPVNGTASKYVESTLKETQKLYKALVDLIQPQHLEILFVDVFSAYSKILIAAYQKHDLRNGKVKKRIGLDIQIFSDSLLKVIPVSEESKSFEQLKKFARDRCS